MDKQIWILIGNVFAIAFFTWLDRRMHPGRREPAFSVTEPEDKEEEPFFIARLKAGYVGPLEDEDF